MEKRKEIAASERAPLAGARVVGEPNPQELLLVTVRVRPKRPLMADGRRMTREEYAGAHGASAEDLHKVEEFAHEHALEIVESSVARRSVVLHGTVQQFSAAFQTSLKRYQAGAVTYRGREGTVSVPESLGDVVEAVLGLDDRPQAQPHIRYAGGRVTGRVATAVSFTPPQVARLYDFPVGGDGAGECIAIIELGGGYSQSDFAAYCAQLGISPPAVTTVSVDGAVSSPGTDPNADGEVMLDVEVAGSVAPKASFALYFAPNTDQGFLDAITTAVHDAVRKPSVISISWGSAESNWTGQAMSAFDSEFQAAAAVGVTVCCASGDNGSSDGVGDGRAHADFPSSSPFALGCGGTRLEASGNAIASETVWNDADGASGGGVSDVFALPSWQANAGVPPSVNPPGKTGRGVPDVCGNADPVTGYEVRVDGNAIVVGGTSAVAPLWAALIALMNQRLGTPVGHLNPRLYALPGYPGPAGPLHDITSGNNGAYGAARGWDACTGLGSPDGTRLLQALGAAG